MWPRVITVLCAVAVAAAMLRNSRVLPAVRAAEKYRHRQSNLVGTWVNELGSKLTIRSPDNKGVFSGTYDTAVSSNNQTVPTSPLTGFQHVYPRNDPMTFGFTVSWTNFTSTTVFVGQRFVNKAGEEVLQTTWLLRAKVDSADNNWLATRVGTNEFRRTK